MNRHNAPILCDLLRANREDRLLLEFSDLLGLTERHPMATGGDAPDSGAEGAAGNVRASRAWKGERSARGSVAGCVCPNPGRIWAFYLRPEFARTKRIRCLSLTNSAVRSPTCASR